MAFVAFIGGFRRVCAAPALLLGAYGIALAFELAMQLAPLAVGSAYPRLAAAAGALAGLPHTFGPGLAGLTAVLSTPGAPWATQSLVGVATATTLAGVAAWTFLSGGILDRLARQRGTGRSAFFAACRHHFWPLARLAVLAGAMYWFLFGGLYPWLLGDPAGAPVRGPTVPADGAPFRSALYVMFGAGAAGAGLLVDFARVRAVVEDRRSMLGALLAALRFLRRRPGTVAGLWLLNAALAAPAITVWTVVAPGPGVVGPTLRGTFLGGQLCVAAHLFALLVAWASQTAYFQGQLAHPTYVARARRYDPDPVGSSGRPA